MLTALTALVADYNQVLGVPLAQVGSYTLWPMVCAIPAKFVIAAWESEQQATND